MLHNANVDPEEIDKFQSIASRWWDRESEFKPLHEINPLRVRYIERQAGGSTSAWSISVVVAASWRKLWLSKERRLPASIWLNYRSR